MVLPDTGSATLPLNKPLEVVIVILTVAFVLVTLLAASSAITSTKAFDKLPLESASVAVEKFNTGTPFVNTKDEPAPSVTFVNPAGYNPPAPAPLNQSTVPVIVPFVKFNQLRMEPRPE